MPSFWNTISPLQVCSPMQRCHSIIFVQDGVNCIAGNQSVRPHHGAISRFLLLLLCRVLQRHWRSYLPGHSWEKMHPEVTAVGEKGPADAGEWERDGEMGGINSVIIAFLVCFGAFSAGESPSGGCVSLHYSASHIPAPPEDCTSSSSFSIPPACKPGTCQ